jgi:hypothetical protein
MRRTDAEQAQDGVGRGMAERLGQHRRCAGAFHHDIGFQLGEFGERAGVQLGAEIGDQPGLGPSGVAIDQVHVQAALHAHHRSQ